MIETCAYARAGLLGNPSDGYNGRAISISVKNFSAQVALFPTPKLCIEPGEEDKNVFGSVQELVERIDLYGYYGGDRLVKGAIKKFFEYCAENKIALSKDNFTIRYSSSIPRQVGLAGSSAPLLNSSHRKPCNPCAARPSPWASGCGPTSPLRPNR